MIRTAGKIRLKEKFEWMIYIEFLGYYWALKLSR